MPGRHSACSGLEHPKIPSQSQPRESHGKVVVELVVHLDAADAGRLVKLEPGECECACWVPLDDVANALCSEGAAAPRAYPQAPAALEAAEPLPPVPSASLAGVYPNALGEGIGRGHLWALRLLARRGLRAPTGTRVGVEDGASSTAT